MVIARSRWLCRAPLLTSGVHAECTPALLAPAPIVQHLIIADIRQRLTLASETLPTIGLAATALRVCLRYLVRLRINFRKANAY